MRRENTKEKLTRKELRDWAKRNYGQEKCDPEEKSNIERYHPARFMGGNGVNQVRKILFKLKAGGIQIMRLKETEKKSVAFLKQIRRLAVIVLGKATTPAGGRRERLKVLHKKEFQTSNL